MLRIGSVVVLVVALMAGACGGTADEIATDGAAIAGTCPIDTPDCVDTVGSSDGPIVANDGPLFVNDEPTDGLSPSAPLVIGEGLTVSEALATEATGVLAVQGFYVNDGTGALLCESLAESFPPQCGGASIPLQNVDADNFDIQSEEYVTWTNETVTLFGEIIDGAFVVASNVSG